MYEAHLPLLDRSTNLPPRWPEFRPMGDCLLWAVTWKYTITEVAHILGRFIELLSLCIKFDKNGLG
jgi:hypothetical protein